MMRAIPGLDSVFSTLAGNPRGLLNSQRRNRWGVVLAVAVGLHGLAILSTIGSQKLPAGQVENRLTQRTAPALDRGPERVVGAKKTMVEAVKRASPAHSGRSSGIESLAASLPAGPFTALQPAVDEP